MYIWRAFTWLNDVPELSVQARYCILSLRLFGCVPITKARVCLSLQQWQAKSKALSRTQPLSIVHE